MNVLGIIAEYNPFHNGHFYQIAQARSHTDADYLVVVMSGDFVQRGTPAVIDKYTRTQMALENGADLVIELPVLWATASAEYFAAAGVALLDKLGVVSSISFGAESDSLVLMDEIAAILADEPAEFKAALAGFLKQGLAFPAARRHALLQSCNNSADYEAILAAPNNILAIEYLKALKQRNSLIAPCAVLRKGSGYHDTELNRLASASAIRRAAFLDADNRKPLHDAMPESAFDLFQQYCAKLPLLNEDSLSVILKYKLLAEQSEGFCDYADCTPDLSNRIRNCLWDYVSFSGFCDLLKSKEVTHTRISRMLLHILLGLTNSDYVQGRALDYIPYLRILGFRKDACPLLHAMKQHTNVPMLTKPADGVRQLQAVYNHNSFARRMFEQDLFAANLYTSLLTEKSGKPIRNEFNHGIVRI